MSAEVPEFIKHNVKAVLLSKSDGIPISEFLSDYRNLHREPLKFRDLGFSSLQELISSIPDIARVMSSKKSEATIFGVGESTTCLPHNSGKTNGWTEKQSTAGHGNKFTQIKGSPDLLTDDNMQPDQFGLWSVCLPIRNCPTQDEQDLIMLFSQAGEVKRTKFSDTFAFIRYGSKEEAQKAEELFYYLDVKIARNHYKVKDGQTNRSTEHNSKLNELKSERKNDKSRNMEAFERQQKNGDQMNKHYSDIDGDIEGGKYRTERELSIMERMLGKCRIDGKQNGYHLEQDEDRFSSSSTPLMHSDRERPYTSSIDTDSRGSGKTSLFVANIESVDDFREMIHPYNPVDVSVKIRNGKTIAYLKMGSEKIARQTIEDLHHKRQKTKCLIVDFAKAHSRSDNDSVSDGSGSDIYTGGRLKMMSGGSMPYLMEEYLDVMPPLLHVSELKPDAGRFHLDCCIFVANFPANTLESILRKAFAKYHVLDVCMINNGSGPGCTKAFLYLPSVYDVIQAIIEMNGSVISDRPVKVDVPYGNAVLKAVVKKTLSKMSSNLA